LLVRLADEWFSFLPAGIVEPLHAELGLSYAQAGALLVILAAGGLVGTPLAVAADHVSRRVLASAGALVYGLCLLAFATFDSFGTLAAAAFLMGAASDALVHGCEVALVDLAGDSLEPALARVNLLGLVGDVLGPLLLSAVAAAGLGWRSAFMIGTALMLAYAGWLASQPLPPPRPRDERPRPFEGVREVMRDRRVLRLAFVATVFSLFDEPFLGFSIAYLERVRGQSHSLATAIAAVVVVGGLAGSALLARRGGRSLHGTLLLGSIAILISIVGIIAAPAVPMQIAAGLVFGGAGAIVWVALQGALLGARPGLAGTTTAVWSTIELLGIGFPLVVGAVADAHGLTSALWLYAAAACVFIPLAATTSARVRGPAAGSVEGGDPSTSH
jgi:predicted MFS family arabinose efflux permease